MNAAPLVRSRTLKRDYRFLALPKSLAPQTSAWIEAHLQSAMVWPDRLEEMERWVVFRNLDYTVFGVVCLNETLAKPCNRMHLVRDESKRSIYLFAGYVVRSAEIQGKWVSRRIEHFYPLLDYVEKHWNDVSAYASGSERNGEASIEEDFHLQVSSEFLNDPAGQGTRDFNHQSSNLVCVAPLSHGDRLWRSAFACPAPVSICTALPTSGYASKGVFMNATVDGIPAPQTLAHSYAEEEERSIARPIESQSYGGYAARDSQTRYPTQRETRARQKSAKLHEDSCSDADRSREHWEFAKVGPESRTPQGLPHPNDAPNLWDSFLQFFESLFRATPRSFPPDPNAMPEDGVSYEPAAGPNAADRRTGNARPQNSMRGFEYDEEPPSGNRRPNTEK